ncbi:MAG: lysine--tRNA ligase [Pseudoflavonifractor capillosus]|uniref:lysine--tRNA ligase n=1 Tax=Pseudoflavonifractor capillosus TaxID=106588 RepID=UPI0023F65871|nr:lysine--tRNA ligase [Pseudoflavonifractor capillosus]MCI5928132.1 lysine--tRNA ligase [Pseudoflavonifractor capillosus]MDY4662272.1 lysine--tRNA ligase [Pseudoflavonifractor capillosus]
MTENTNAPVQEEQSLSELLQIRRDKLKELQDAGMDPFQQTKYSVTAHSQEIKDNFETMEGQTVSVAGRLMSKRGMGKAVFCDLQDVQGRIQLYVRIDELGEEPFARFKKVDIGDIVGVEGEAFRTKRGEISVKANKVTLLSKSLRPLPEKFHGLTDKETRYRQRYVDLIVNPEVRQAFVVRSRFIKHVRDFLDNRGYMEVETPVLNTISGGATARPFITHHNTLDIDMYMRIATELPLKRLIVGGMDRVYELGRIFRNEGMDPKHNPEFTTVELYEAFADFNDMMDLFEELLSSAAQKILGTYQVEWQGEKIDLTPGWPRLPMHEAVKQYCGIDFMAITSDEEAVAAAKSIGVELPETADKTWGNALYECFDQKVEEKLIQPTFITMHPVDVSPLAKRSPKDPRLTERFELFICHSEMGNAFSELNDPIDQRGRFQKQVELRDKGDDEAGMMDEDFLNALEYGMPPTGGLGIGIDRCVMMLTNSDTIRDVILFPTMKPLASDTAAKAAGQAAAKAAPAAAPVEKIDFSNVKIEPLFEEMVDFETFSKSDFRAVKIKECSAVPKSKKLLKFVLDDGTGTDRVILSGIHEYYEPEQLVGKTAIAIVNLPPRKMMGIDSCGMLISAVHEEDGHEGLNLLMVDDRIPAGAKLY